MNLKELRERANLPRAYVAKHLDVDQSSVAYWELGRYSPSRKYHRKLARLYGVPEAEIKALADSIKERKSCS